MALLFRLGLSSGLFWFLDSNFMCISYLSMRVASFANFIVDFIILITCGEKSMLEAVLHPLCCTEVNLDLKIKCLYVSHSHSFSVCWT